MRKPISVILADDHNLFREGVNALLAQDRQIRVIGQASDGGQTVELVASHRPDVLLLDVEMPGGSVRATIGQVIRASPRTRIVVLTMHRDAILRKLLLTAGAVDYLTKTIPGNELIEAIHSVARATVTSASRRTASARKRRSQPRPLLTDREAEVLMLMAQALSNHSIAEHLSITTGTVKRHANNIFRKLDATSRMDAVQRGDRLGILDR